MKFALCLCKVFVAVQIKRRTRLVAKSEEWVALLCLNPGHDTIPVSDRSLAGCAKCWMRADPPQLVFEQTWLL